MSKQISDAHNIQSLYRLVSQTLERVKRLESHVGLTEPDDSGQNPAPIAPNESGLATTGTITAVSVTNTEDTKPQIESRPAAPVDSEIASLEDSGPHMPTPARQVITFLDESTASAANDTRDAMRPAKPKGVRAQTSQQSKPKTALESALVRPSITQSQNSKKSQHTCESLESLIGGRLFTWLGGVLLVLASAFFAVWSWRNLNLPDWSRVALLHSIGLFTIVAANWFRQRKLEIHSHTLNGVGIFALYASALAMTHLYELGAPLHRFIGFADGIVITALAVFLSLRLRSLGTILLGAAGGYLTPFLTIHVSSDSATIGVYLALLNTGLLVVGEVGGWRFLKPMAMAVTWSVLAAFLLLDYFPSEAAAQTMLGLHFGIFALACSSPGIVMKEARDIDGNWLAITNTVMFLGCFAIVSLQRPNLIAVACFALAVVHAGVAILWTKRVAANTVTAYLHLQCLYVLLTTGLTIWFRESPDLLPVVWAILACLIGVGGFAGRSAHAIANSFLILSMAMLMAGYVDVPVLFIQQKIDGWYDAPTVRWLLLSALTAITGASSLVVTWHSKYGQRLVNEETLHHWQANYFGLSNILLLVAAVFWFRDDPNWWLVSAVIDCCVLMISARTIASTGVHSYATKLSLVTAMSGLALMIYEQFNLTEHWDYVSRLGFYSCGTLLVWIGLANRKLTLAGKLSGQQTQLEPWLATLGHTLIVGSMVSDIVVAMLPVAVNETVFVVLLAGLAYALALLVLARKIGGETYEGLGHIMFLMLLVTSAATLANCFQSLDVRWTLLARVGLAAVGLAHVLVGMFWSQSDSKEVFIRREFLVVAGHGLIAAILAIEARYQFAGAGWHASQFGWYLCLVWSAYALLLYWIGHKKRDQVSSDLASILQLTVIFVALVASIKTFVHLEQAWCNLSRLGLLLTGAVLVGSGIRHWRSRIQFAASNPRGMLHGILSVAGHAGLMGWLTMEIMAWFSTGQTGSTQEMATLSIAWGAYASVLMGLGLWLRYPLYRFAGITIFSVVLTKVFLIDLAQFELIIRVVALLCLGLLLLGVSTLYHRFKTSMQHSQPGGK